MGFKFENGKAYEMPVFFGPAPIPKNLDSNGKAVLNKPGDIEAITVLFETDAAKINSLLPEGYTSNAPVLSVAVCEFANIGNFAGNTYYLINISTPVHFDGARDHLDGDLILAMFENHGEPIVGGRDQLGYSKIFCDIPRFVNNNPIYKASAFSWGFKFMDLAIDLRKPAENPDKIKQLAAKSQGKFNYKYIQKTPDLGEPMGAGGADACYSTFNPKAWKKPDDYAYTFKPVETQFCSGSVKFYNPEPDDMPTYWHIGQFLAKLEIKKYLGAQHTIYNDPCDYSHVYRLK